MCLGALRTLQAYFLIKNTQFLNTKGLLQYFYNKIKIKINFFQEWNDVNLRWNSSEYGGVKDLRIPPHRIWKPDVLMYNR